MVFANSFLISVKKLGLLTNMSQWIKDFGCRGIIYMGVCVCDVIYYILSHYSSISFCLDFIPFNNPLLNCMCMLISLLGV
jgi:hypothetical protein